MRALVVVALVALALAPERAAACASCGAGDPTLTLVGTEQPFAGRLRVSIAASASGTNGAERTSDRRLALGVAWAPVHWLVLSAQAPLVLRTTEDASLAHQTGIGPGDLDLRARFVVLRDRTLAPTHLVTLQVGAQIPLAPALVDAQGVPLGDGAQSASATVAPTVGLVWSIYAAPFSLQTYALLAIPTRGGDGTAPPVELRAASLALVQVVPSLSLVIGPETRAWIGREAGVTLFGTVGAMVGVGDATPYVLLRAPLAGGWSDGHAELFAIELGVAIDA